MWLWFAVAQAVTLDEAWERAESSPELSAAAAGAERSRATVGLARAGLMPKVVVSGGYTWNDEEVAFDLGGVLPPPVIALTGPIDPLVVQERDWWQASVTAVVPLIDVDAWATLGAAGQQANAAEADVAVARRQVRAGVARAFYGTLLARDGVAIAEQALAVAQRQEEVAKALVTAGSSPPRTALEAEGARLSAERDLAGARAQQARAEEALRRFAAVEPGTALEVAAVAAPGSVDDLLAADRPERQAAAARVEAAGRARTATGLAWAPDVTGQVTGLWTENQGFADDKTFVVAKLEATWMWDGGAKSARGREAAAAQVQARAAKEALDRRVEEEVRVAWAAYEQARLATVAAQREREASEARLVEAEAAFAEGVLPFVELSRAALGRSAGALAERSAAYAEAVAATELALLSG